MPETKNSVDEFIKPIINASYPGVLAALSIAALQIGAAEPVLKYTLILSAIGYLASSFSLFFYTIYQTKRGFWILAAGCFITALSASMFSVILLIFI